MVEDEIKSVEVAVKSAKNKVSSQYLCQRFEREYRVVIQNMASEESEWQDS